MPVTEQKTEALEKFQGFTKESLIAYAFEREVISREEFRLFLANDVATFQKVLREQLEIL